MIDVPDRVQDEIWFASISPFPEEFLKALDDQLGEELLPDDEQEEWRSLSRMKRAMWLIECFLQDERFMPGHACRDLGIQTGSTYADAARDLKAKLQTIDAY